MRSPFDRKQRPSGPSNREVQNIRRRANQGPGIEKADQRAHSTLPKDGSEELTGYPLLPEGPPSDPRHPARKGETDAARQRADEAHSRFTNPAVDAAHNRADFANTNADGRLSRANGGTVSGTLAARKFLENFTLANTVIPATSTVSWTFGSTVNHITMAHVADGTNGWILLPTVGSTPVFIVINNDTSFAIRNARANSETVHARIWEEAY